MLKRPSIGVENFRVLAESELFVDKTALIAELLDHREQVTLITRPRRWGKTLNLSMLQHFFSPQVDRQTTAGLFDQLKIASLKGGAYMQHQGQYPVIYITFKDIKVSHFSDALSEIKTLFFMLYSQYPELRTSEKLLPEEKAKYTSIVSEQVDTSSLVNALLFLSTLLHKHYNKKVIILIDEYDTPLNNAYNHQFLAEMTEFISNLFSKALKTNPALEKGVMSGILRVAKVGILSGLNNLEVYTVLDEFYAPHFGFTEEEVITLVKECGLTEDKLETIKTWYNSYTIGGTLIYNPWSIMNCLSKEGDIKPYWVESGGTDLIEKAIMNSAFPIKKDLENLLEGKTLCKLLDPHVNYKGILTVPDAFWSFLLSAGYLKAEQAVLDKEEGLYQCNLAIPNREARILYKRYVSKQAALPTSSMPDIMDTEEDIPTPIHSQRHPEHKASEAKAEVRRPLLSLVAQAGHKHKLSDAETMAKVGKFASTPTAVKATTANSNDTVSSTENESTEKHKRQRTFSTVSQSASSHLEKRG